MKFYYFSDEEQEEPCEGRLSSTVLWEGRGEIPPPDPIIGHLTEPLHRQTYDRQTQTMLYPLQEL